MKYLKLFEEYTSYHGKDLIVVDIQPEYEDFLSNTFSIGDFCQFLNDNIDIFSSVTLLYNGYDTLGMVSESDYIYWLCDNGLDEDIVEQITFCDKGYAFFRYCIDSDIDDNITINLIKYMVEKDINDSRDIDEENWDELIKFYKDDGLDMSDVRTLLEHSGDMISIPDLMSQLEKFKNSNVLLTGGHVEECLREVVLALKVLDIHYETLDEFIY